MTLPKVLITGGAGQLARDLAALMPGADSPNRSELSVTNIAALRAHLASSGAELVFNCAAFNGVDQAETLPEEAFAVNAAGAANLAIACREAGAQLVHFSTNFVFGGEAEEPYSEADAPRPAGAYARSKLEGEERVLHELPGALVIRSAGLFGHHGSAIKGGSFPDRIVARARAGQPLRVVADQFLNPTYTGHLAGASIAAQKAGATGLLHLVAEGCCSFHEFATEIISVAGLSVGIEAISTPAPAAGTARRPKNGCLRSDRWDALPSWRQGVATFWRTRPQGPA